jgi:hypothetical protein
MPLVIDLSAGTRRISRNLQADPDHPTDRIELDPPWYTDELTITLREVLPGQRFEDTSCIAEVMLWAAPERSQER